MNIAHNLPIEDLIKALNKLQSAGYSHVDAVVCSDLDLGFRPIHAGSDKIEQDFSDLLSLVP